MDFSWLDGIFISEEVVESTSPHYIGRPLKSIADEPVMQHGAGFDRLVFSMDWTQNHMSHGLDPKSHRGVGLEGTGRSRNFSRNSNLK